MTRPWPLPSDAMSWGFRKSFRLGGRGARLNLGKRSAGLNVGRRGARLSMNPRTGKRVELSRKGLFWRKRL